MKSIRSRELHAVLSQGSGNGRMSPPRSASSRRQVRLEGEFIALALQLGVERAQELLRGLKAQAPSPRQLYAVTKGNREGAFECVSNSSLARPSWPHTGELARQEGQASSLRTHLEPHADGGEQIIGTSQAELESDANETVLQRLLIRGCQR